MSKAEAARRSAGRATAARRAHGVYYTPAPIADHIVRDTVGAWLGQHDDLPTILDPACGAGAFLVSAYRFLLDWRLRALLAHLPLDSTCVESNPDGHACLTLAERARLLQTCIFGVDIDAEAVALTRATLLAVLTEDEPLSTPLPDLSANIRWGNALVGSDGPLQPPEETLRSAQGDSRNHEAPPLDWEVAFPGVVARGGWDVIIGNPPYVSFYARESRPPDPALAAYLARRYGELVGGRHNLFLAFLALALWLRHRHGVIGMIVPDTLAVNPTCAPLRRALAQAGLRRVDRLDCAVFADATVRTVIPLVGPSEGPTEFRVFAGLDDYQADHPRRRHTPDGATLLSTGRAWPFTSPRVEDVLARIEARSVRLAALATVRDGVNPGPRACRDAILNPVEPPRPTWRPVIVGRHVTPYRLLPTTDVVDYDRARLTPGDKRRGASFRDPRIFDAPKLVSRQTADTLVFALDESGVCALNSVHCTQARDGRRDTLLFLLGVLNSRLLRFYYRQRFQEVRGVFPQVHIAALRQLPIPDATADQRAALVALVEEVLRLGRDTSSPLPAALLTQIDSLVCDLYSVRPDEIE